MKMISVRQETRLTPPLRARLGVVPVRGRREIEGGGGSTPPPCLRSASRRQLIVVTAAEPAGPVVWPTALFKLYFPAVSA